MTVYVDSSLRDFVQDQRKNKPTEIICQKIEHIPFYKNAQKMKDIMDSEYFLENMSDTNRIECKNPLYNVIQYSKFGWMLDASHRNTFESDFFVWMDAGLSRFFTDRTGSKILNYETYPGQHFQNMKNNIKGKVVVQKFKGTYQDLCNAHTIDDSYFLDNRSIVMGGMFCGDTEAIALINKEINEVFDAMLSKNIVNNEQIALGYLVINKPELFAILEHAAGNPINYDLIRFVGT